MYLKKTVSYATFLLLAAAVTGPVLTAEEPNWAQQLVGPVQGTNVHHNETSDFGRYKFVTGPETGGVIAKVVSIEGKKSEIIYKAPGKTPFEIYSVYKKFFANNGYETLFACEGKDCGQNFRGVWYGLNPFENNPGWDNSAPITNGSWESQFYIAGRKKSAAGDTYAAVFSNSGWWNHPAYRVDVAQPGDLDTEVVAISRTAKAPADMASTAEFFDGTHIYNNHLFEGQSTFAILGYGKKNEEMSDFNAIRTLESLRFNANAEYLFIIINGQQTPCFSFCFGEEGDRIFGRGLTGIRREKVGTGLDKFKYSIHTGRVAGTASVASTLFDMYKDKAVILDILNAKYEWMHLPAAKGEVYKYIRDDIIGKVVKAFEISTGKKPKIFITGFSRGGLLTYELSQHLTNLDIVAAVSVDPVINHLQSAEKELVQSTAYFDDKTNGWKTEPPSWRHLNVKSFPVLRRTNDKVAYYNVFQRKAASEPGNKVVATPIGVAVQEAKSPCDFEGFPCRPYIVQKPYAGPLSVVNQYDSGIKKHAPDMLDTYVPWIIKIVQNHFPLPVEAAAPATAESSGSPAPSVQPAPAAAQPPMSPGQSASPPVSPPAAGPVLPKPEEPLVVVPDVMGKLFLVAKDILVAQGLKVAQTGKTAGFVRGQSPSGNNRVKKGTTVTLKLGY